MDTRQYTRLLIQLLLFPSLALSLLALGLGYSLQRVEMSASWVDHSDRVIAHANRILLLIVDEETGVRGYLISRDPSFLAPYNRAEQILPLEFDRTFAMIRDNPGQTARLEQLRQSYAAWKAITDEDLAKPPGSRVDMFQRKRRMDRLRAQASGFARAEESLRNQLSAAADRMGLRTRRLLVAIVVLLALAIVWLTLASFARLRRLFHAQLREVEKQRNLAAQREQWLNTTLRSIGDAVIACDPSGRVALMNPPAEQLTGWTEREARGRPLPEVFRTVTEPTRALAENPVEKVRRTGGTVGPANHTILIRRDGEECGIDDSAAPIKGAEGQMVGIVLVFRDCTQQRRAQTALMRAEKLAAAGKLAATIAHEVNNPLEGLINLLFLAGESVELAEAQRWLVQAQSEVARLSHITRRTLGFYRESTQPTCYRPAEVMEEVLSFYVPEALAKNIRLQAQLRTQQQTYGVPGELRQVLSNLITNSMDALAAGGTIRLVVRQVTDLKDPAGQGVRITVADNGTGIPAATLRHIFEPFFTTKVETGTGLGLWVSKELIEKQGGSLRVRSTIHGSMTGTVFSIYMPIHAREEERGS